MPGIVSSGKVTLAWRPQDGTALIYSIINHFKSRLMSLTLLTTSDDHLPCVFQLQI